jgi:hypothetical protein
MITAGNPDDRELAYAHPAIHEDVIRVQDRRPAGPLTPGPDQTRPRQSRGVAPSPAHELSQAPVVYRGVEIAHEQRVL